MKGLTVPLPDVVVVTLGIDNDIEVWARDPHFPTMQKMLPKLKLFQEPPKHAPWVKEASGVKAVMSFLYSKAQMGSTQVPRSSL